VGGRGVYGIRKGTNSTMEQLIGSRNGLMILLPSIPSPLTGESQLISSPSTGEDKGGGEAGLIPHFNTCLRQAGRGARGDLKRLKERVIL